MAPAPAHPTVLVVTWDGPVVDGATARFVDALGGVRAVTADAAGTPLVGLRAATDVDVQLVAPLDGAQVCSPPTRARTGALPVGLPEAVLASGLPGPETPAFLAVSLLTETERRAVIFETGTGAPVWVWTLPEGLGPETMLYRVHVRADGGGILANVHEGPDTPGGIFRVDWDGAATFLPVPGATRDFVELPDGAVAVLSAEMRRTATGGLVHGDRLFEVALDGAAREIWNMFDDYPHEWGETTRVPHPDGDFVEWAHANGVGYDASEDDFLLSLPDIQTIARVDRASGDLVWRVGEQSGEYVLDGAAAPTLDMPHSVQVLDDGALLVFNRRGPGRCSGAAELALDPAGGRAWERWRSDADPCLLTTFLGEALRVEDGDTVIDFSSAGRIDIVGPDGALRWRLGLDLGAGFGFVDRAEALGW